MLLATIIREKLQALNPLKLEIINESNRHRGHMEEDSDESHFSILIVSEMFDNLSLLERHRKVKSLLSDELKNKIHALSLKTLTEEEYKAKNI